MILMVFRPEITVHLKENGQDKYLGKVISQWAMCDMVFDIYDERDQLIYNINGDCCQWGLYCNCPCQPCSKIFFEIRTPDGEGVGEIAKVQLISIELTNTRPHRSLTI